jgi:hypothetical protein
MSVKVGVSTDQKFAAELAKQEELKQKIKRVNADLTAGEKNIELQQAAKKLKAAVSTQPVIPLADLGLDALSDEDEAPAHRHTAGVTGEPPTSNGTHHGETIMAQGVVPNAPTPVHSAPQQQAGTESASSGVTTKMIEEEEKKVADVLEKKLDPEPVKKLIEKNAKKAATTKVLWNKNRLLFLRTSLTESEHRLAEEISKEGCRYSDPCADYLRITYTSS